MVAVRVVQLISILFVMASGSAVTAQFQIEEEIEVKGVISTKVGERVGIRTDTGLEYDVLIPLDDSQTTVTLKGGNRLISKTQVDISGNLKIEQLKQGDLLRLVGKVNRRGITEGIASGISLVLDSSVPGMAATSLKSSGGSEFQEYRIIAPFYRSINERLLVHTPSNSNVVGKTLAFDLPTNVSIQLKSSNSKYVMAGMRIESAVIQRLNTGDFIVKSIKLVSQKNPSFVDDYDSTLRKKYAHLDGSIVAPRLIRSQHFVFMSDISEQHSKVLLEKLETMYALFRSYFGAQPATVIEGFIVSDISKWPADLLTEPSGIAKIQAKAGICFYRSLGNARRAIIYSYADDGVIQHECTHGFCALAFGSTGPTWLAEGLAELGQYWRLGKKEINVPPFLISYIKGASPQKQLLDIAVPGKVPAGNWQDYAWRWALCHMLANNPNYANSFKPLAISLMQQTPIASFERTFGKVAPQISFEYSLFLEQFQNGYRSDLNAWQWNTKFYRLEGNAQRKTKVSAKYGWQASGLILEKGKSYDIASVGSWNITQENNEISAEGNEDGSGKLVGAFFSDFTLSKQFELGVRAQFVSPADGQLFLRCNDGFGELSDNTGEIEVFMRLMP